jgi:hypothetical protein
MEKIGSQYFMLSPPTLLLAEMWATMAKYWLIFMYYTTQRAKRQSLVQQLTCIPFVRPS